MARVPYPTRDDLPEHERHIYDRLEQSRGTPVGHIWRALANAPNLLDKILSYADELRQGTTIDKRYRELGVMMVGLVTKSAYEFDHHWNAALKAGVRREQLEALGDYATSPAFDDKDRAVLAFAKESTANGEVSDAAWDALRKHFNQREAIEIVLTVAWYNNVVRILLPLRIEHEDWFKRM